MIGRNAHTAAAAIIALLLLACGGANPTDDQPAAGGAPELSIESPAEGAEVSVPFTVEFSSSVPLGADHHVHVFFDGNEDDFEIVESDSFEVSDLSSGDHTMGASLRNAADHSAAGADAEVSVTVVGSGDGGSDDGGTGGGYDY